MQLAVTEERLHLAQELHDVVAHSMSVIAVQAGMADAAFDSRPDEARGAVHNILETSRSSLAEIRRLLGIPRFEQNGQRGYSPAPRLQDLTALLSGVEANGLSVGADVDVCPGMPAAVELERPDVITTRLITEFAAQRSRESRAAAVVAGLTEREAEVLEAIAGGQSNNEVADALHMSYGTVKTHVSHLLTKLDCRDRAQLVMVAYESGFVTPGETAV